MFKIDVSYDDFDGETQTETLHFHLNKVELIEMEVKEKQGFEQRIREISKAQDYATMFNIWQDIVLKAYGVRSDDSKKFLKSKEATEEFKGSLAYEELMMRLCTDEQLAIQFVNGIVPKGLNSNQPALPNS